MAPGDATMHHALTVHGACENLGASPRLSFTVTHFDADALYTGAPYKQTDELSPRLRVNEPFDQPEVSAPAGVGFTAAGVFSEQATRNQVRWPGQMVITRVYYLAVLAGVCVGGPGPLR